MSNKLSYFLYKYNWQLYELIYNINCFNIKDYKERVKIFMSKNGINEDGCAARRVVDYINQYLDCDEIGEKWWMRKGACYQ